MWCQSGEQYGKNNSKRAQTTRKAQRNGEDQNLTARKYNNGAKTVGITERACLAFARHSRLPLSLSPATFARRSRPAVCIYTKVVIHTVFVVRSASRDVPIVGI